MLGYTQKLNQYIYPDPSIFIYTYIRIHIKLQTASLNGHLEKCSLENVDNGFQLNRPFLFGHGKSRKIIRFCLPLPTLHGIVTLPTHIIWSRVATHPVFHIFCKQSIGLFSPRVRLQFGWEGEISATISAQNFKEHPPFLPFLGW